jgi:hypothetical protein
MDKSEPNNMQLSLVLQSGIEKQDMVVLLNKLLDNTNSQLEIEKKHIDLLASEARFDRYFIVFGFILSFASSGVVMFYLKELIDNCATNVVKLVGVTAKYGIENAELLVRNSASYAWNSIVYAGNYIGILDSTYQTTYIKEGFTGMHISEATNTIVENTSMASLIVTLLLYIMITYSLVFIVIIILKLLQSKKINLSFIFLKMAVETR